MKADSEPACCAGPVSRGRHNMVGNARRQHVFRFRCMNDQKTREGAHRINPGIRQEE